MGAQTGVDDVRTLYVVVRDRDGRIAQQAIRPAIVESDYDASLTTLALRKGLEPLATVCNDSPRQAAKAMQTLADLGDVEFQASDFEPEWFDPANGVSTIDGLLGHRARGARSLSAGARAQLDLLRRALGEASRRSCTFYLVEPEPGEEPRFASV